MAFSFLSQYFFSVLTILSFHEQILDQSCYPAGNMDVWLIFSANYRLLLPGGSYLIC